MLTETQAQGITQQAYSAPAMPAQPPAAGTPTVNNPYANYGYGAGAQHNKPQPVAGPSQPYRPPPNTQAYATAATQPSLGYGQQQAYGQQQYQAYPARPQPGARPPHQTAAVAGPPPAAAAAPAGQQAYAWGQPQPQASVQQQQQQQQPGFRPQPVAQQAYPAYQQQYYSPAAQQSYTPPPQQPSYRPNVNANPSPSPMQPPAPTPFRPPTQQNRPPRPPMSSPQVGGLASGPGGGGGFPPAKRPRFDAPPGPAGNRMNNRPPNSNNNNMNNTNSMQAGGPKQGPGPSSSQPFGNRNVSGRGPHNQFHGHGQNTAAAVRPPIHLGNGGPPPVAFNAGPSGPAAMGPGAGAGAGMVRPPPPAGGMAAPMRGHPARGRGAPNAPRGPANMRRNANANGNDVSSTFSASSSAGNLPGFNQAGGGGGGGAFKGNKGFEKAQAKKRNQGGKEKDNKEVKPTMTDFRIVGVKFGSGQNVWEWGIVDGKVPDLVGVAVGEGETENQLQAQIETHDGLVKVEEEEAEPASVSVSAPIPTSQANQSPEKKVTIKQEPESLDPSPVLEGEGEDVAAPSVTGTEALIAEAEDVEEKGKVKDEEKEGKDEKEQEKEKRGEKRKAKSPDAGVFYPPYPKMPFPFHLVLCSDFWFFVFPPPLFSRAPPPTSKFLIPKSFPCFTCVFFLWFLFYF